MFGFLKVCENQLSIKNWCTYSQAARMAEFCEMCIMKHVPNIARSMVKCQEIRYRNVGFHLKEKTTTLFLRDTVMM